MQICICNFKSSFIRSETPGTQKNSVLKSSFKLNSDEMSHKSAKKLLSNLNWKVIIDHIR